MRSRPRTEDARPAPKQEVIDAWFDTVVAGEADEPHPVLGDRLKVKFTDGLMTLAGELQTERDREELLGQARARIGRGLREIDARNLRVAERHEAHGVLDQILIAAFEEPGVAELAGNFIAQRSRHAPKLQEVVSADQVDRLKQLLPDDFAREARKALERKNQAVLILRVDETDAFDVRRLLEEDTRSTWTLALPPEVAA